MSSIYDQPSSYRNRRPSLSGQAFGTSNSFAPHNDFRQNTFSDRGQYNDPYGNGSGSGFSEVSGQSGPLPPLAQMPSGPSPDEYDPPLPLSQSYPQSNGFAGSSYPPPPGMMNTSYSMGTREPFSSPPFESSGFEPTGGQFPRAAAAYPDSYDSPLSDNFFPPPMDDGFSARGRTLSTGGGGFGPPALLPPAQSMTPYSSHHYSKRGRRASSVGPGMGLGGYAADPFRRPGGVNIKFRLKGGYRQGVSLREANDSARLSRSVNYSLHDLAPDHRGRITLKVRVRFKNHHSGPRILMPSFLLEN